MFGDIQTNLFEGIYEVEHYFQIAATFLFLFVALLLLPMNLTDLTLTGSIPLEFWLFISMPIAVRISSGILRWIMELGNVFGEYSLERVEDRLYNDSRESGNDMSDEDSGANDSAERENSENREEAKDILKEES